MTNFRHLFPEVKQQFLSGKVAHRMWGWGWGGGVAFGFLITYPKLVRVAVCRKTGSDDVKGYPLLTTLVTVSVIVVVVVVEFSLNKSMYSCKCQDLRL